MSLKYWMAVHSIALYYRIAVLYVIIWGKNKFFLKKINVLTLRLSARPNGSSIQMAPTSHKHYSGSSTIQASGQHHSKGIGKIDPEFQMWVQGAADSGFNCRRTYK